MKQSIIATLLLLFGLNIVAAHEPYSEEEWGDIEEFEDLDSLFKELMSEWDWDEESEYTFYADEGLSVIEDCWYKCTYSYTNTYIGDNSFYKTDRRKEITIAVNNYRMLFRFLEKDSITYSKPILLEWDDDSTWLASKKEFNGFYRDFSLFFTSTNQGYDSYMLSYKEKLEEPLPFDSNERVRKGLPLSIRYILLALLPAILLFAFILWSDRLRPEPPKELIIAFIMGLLTLPMAEVMEKFIILQGWSSSLHSVWMDCFKRAFVGAAIPEELCKIIILWLFFRWRKHQDEMMDGIVYAVCIGLAFAAGENIEYIMSAMVAETTSTIPFVAGIGVARALTAVPCHFCLAVIMGYFFSYYLFSPKKKLYYLMMAFLIPVLCHGLYDFLAFMDNVHFRVLGIVISYLFYLVFFGLNNICIKTIRKALEKDKQ